MKIRNLLFTASSLVYGLSAELPEVATEITQPALPSQEIVSLQMPSLLQNSMQQQPLKMPEPLQPTVYKKPWVAMTLNSLFPGLGHVYLGDREMASGFLLTTGLGYSLVLGDTIRDPSAFKIAFSTVSASSMYSAYATYRDVRNYNGSSLYSYRMPQDTLTDLTLAPFRWSVIKKPQVWGGVLGFLAAGAVFFKYTFPSELRAKVQSASAHRTPPICALPVGVGEEALFRGFLQSALSEEFNPLAGTIASSIIFGAAHAANASAFPESQRWRYYAFSMPFIATIGAYCGWMTHKSHSLQEAVALHTWYDFILFLGAASSAAMMSEKPTFAFSKSF